MIKPKKVKELFIAIAKRITRKHREKSLSEHYDLSNRVHGLDMVIGEIIESDYRYNNRTYYDWNGKN